ncbi:hypothetical protein [Microcystis phage Mae-JY09]
MIGVVVPTIAGREALLERTVAAYRQHTAEPMTLIVVRDRPTIGAAWNDGAEAAMQAGVRWLHLSADDVEPHAGWDEACIAAATHGGWPSPRILNPDGSLHSCGSMGGGMLLPECADGTPCATSPFPFLAARYWHRVGPALDAHYYADDHLSWRARLQGFTPVVSRGFTLTHLEGTTGRPAMVQRAMADRARFLAAVGVESPAPREVLACA